MLILAKKIGESIILSNDIIITFLGFSGNKVRVGVDTSTDIAVDLEDDMQKSRGLEKIIKFESLIAKKWILVTENNLHI